VIKKIIKILVQIINIILVILSLVLVFIAIFKKEWFELFIERMKWVINWLWFWNYLIIFISSSIESFPVLWVLLPWQNILLIVWWFFGHDNYINLVYVVIIATLWAITWNYIWYILWKYYWDTFFWKYWLWFWIWKTEVKYLKKWIDKWGPWWITVWKFHPLTRSFLPFIAWSMWMKSWKFMFYNAIWSFIRASTLVILWVLFAEYYKILLEYSGTILVVVLLIVGIYIYKYKKSEFMDYFRDKNAEIEEISKK